MKGLILSSFYASKKSLITYLIIGIVLSIVFAFFSPMMCCFMLMVMLLSPVSDNLKREKDSKWMYYVSTLPTHRHTYVKAYFAFYGLLILLGLIIGAIICLIVTQDIMVTLFSAFIGIGMACTYALMFPLTFKFGPENSNVIMLTTAVVAVMPILIKAGSISKIASNPLVLVATGSYALLGVIIFVISYFSSLSIFKKQEL